MIESVQFKALIATQYCDNFQCSSYNVIGAKNIRIHSRQKGQVYCSICKNRWVITKGSFLFGLKTPLNKIIDTLLMMARGVGLRKACRQQGVTPGTAKKWIAKAAEKEKEITDYMQSKMLLEQDQIDLFWEFIHLKTNSK